MRHKYHLIIACPDRCGIVAAVSSFVAKHQGLVIEADHHTDVETNWFFMRYEIDADTLQLSTQSFHQQFADIAAEFAMQYRLHDNQIKQRVLLLASRDAHCLEDILYRWHNHELHCEIVAVVSNHDTLKRRSEWYDLPFYHIPINHSQKATHFAEITALAEKLQVDTLVLARYMQILPSELCEKYSGHIINIHHSFLPSFVGAKPYAQAFERGVKLIGATSHYVTTDLDEGPIIEQDVIRISHRQNLKDYIRLGKDIERAVLARALKLHLENRVIIHTHKTIVWGQT